VAESKYADLWALVLHHCLSVLGLDIEMTGYGNDRKRRFKCVSYVSGNIIICFMLRVTNVLGDYSTTASHLSKEMKIKGVKISTSLKGKI